MKSNAMRNVGALARREMGFYFNSPVAYITITLFLVVCGVYLFSMDDIQTGRSFFEDNEASLRKLFDVIPVIFILIIPAITMRLLAEEKRSGTIELLFTMPVTDTQIALGKFFGGLAFLAITLIATIPLPVIVGTLGSLDVGALVAGYLGLFLLGAAYLAIGLMASSWTDNQIVAYLLAALICAFFYAISGMVSVVWAGAQDTLAALSFEGHFANITRGVIDTRDVVFYLSFVVVALVITVQSLQARNWK
ncbi:MAG: ABC transporter [Deltaproteobacteria bacterium]|nr:MAG: ABC transporter [Deltaproteobacteria bacterium]